MAIASEALSSCNLILTLAIVLALRAPPPGVSTLQNWGPWMTQNYTVTRSEFPRDIYKAITGLQIGILNPYLNLAHTLS